MGDLARQAICERCGHTKGAHRGTGGVDGSCWAEKHRAGWGSGAAVCDCLGFIDNVPVTGAAPVEASAGVATEPLDLTRWHPDFIPCAIEGDSPDGDHVRPLRDDERIVITAGQLRRMGAKPEIWPEYEEPVTGRYDEIVKEVAEFRERLHPTGMTAPGNTYVHGSGVTATRSILDRAASALKEAQQRIAELEAVRLNLPNALADFAAQREGNYPGTLIESADDFAHRFLGRLESKP